LTLLNVNNIHTYYELSHILFGASLKVNEGEVVFLLGRNGVGKTTTFRSIIGIPTPKSGSIKFLDRELVGLPTHKIARLGISLVPEGRKILTGLTVQENLLIAVGQKNKTESESIRWTIDMIYELFPILKKRKRQEGVTLSGGEQQMLTIGRGLMSNPRLLLIDEPVEGLAPLIAKTVGDTLLTLKKNGTTMLCIDDDTNLASRTTDRVYFMDQGRIVWEGPIQDALINDQEIARKFLGVG
jgi:branched-chain amino acid transport system ATP-binding protein